MMAPPHRPARNHLAPARAAGISETYAGQYGRLFPDLEPLDCEEDLIFALGRAGGMCDPRTSVRGAGDTGHGAAGWPFFGQFIAHDITADRSPLGKRADPSLIRNFRTPRANLECLYDAGSGTPFLYDRGDPARFLLGINDVGAADDLPRNQQGIALIGDPRNDVHLFVNQLMRELLADSPRFYRPDGEPFIPFEFADAAYRYGHDQIRDTYVIRAGADPVPIFPDLLGFQPVPAARVVDWAYLFDLPNRPAHQHAKLIDGRLAHSLIDLPLEITGHVDVEEYHSLAVRDLQRGQALGLPSGEAIARAIGAEPLTAAETGLSRVGWARETPLWYYVLKEAEVRAGGERLGPVGGRIVAEVLLGILDGDPESYRTVDPAWRPTLPTSGLSFGMGDLLTFAAAARHS